MVYYLKIAGIGVKVNCPNNLYLFDEWKIFFEEKWGKAFLVKKTKSSIVVFLNGPITKGGKTIKETIPDDSVKLPGVIDNKIYFDNLLNSAYLLILIKGLISKLIVEKGGLVMHASGVVVNNKAVLIMGESGSGKTTTLKKLTDKYKAIAEDEVVMNKVNNEILVEPVLFSSKLESSLLVRGSFSVGAIITIKKNKSLRLVKMSQNEALMFLLEQSKNQINNKERAESAISYASLLNDKVYVLNCKKDDKLDEVINNLYL